MNLPNREQALFGLLGIGIGIVFSVVASALIFLGKSDVDNDLSTIDRSRMGVLLYLNPESEQSYVVMWCFPSHNGRTGGENSRLALQYRTDQLIELGLFIDPDRRRDREQTRQNLLETLDGIPEFLAADQLIHREMVREFGCESRVVGRPLQ